MMSATVPMVRSTGESAGRSVQRTGEQQVAAGGVRWHVNVVGQGPLMLMLHGTGSSWRSFDQLIGPLSQRYRVVAPDLPGHADSRVRRERTLSLPGMTAATGELLQALEIEPAVIVGHSAGAAVAARLVLDRHCQPQRLIALNGAFFPFGGAAAQFLSPLTRLLASGGLLARLASKQAVLPGTVERLIDGTGSTLDARGIAMYRGLFSRASHVDAALSMMARWDLHGLVDAMRYLGCPLDLLVGTHDLSVPPEQARRLATRVPSASVHALPGLGHLAHEEQPERVAELILACAEASPTANAGEADA